MSLSIEEISNLQVLVKYLEKELVEAKKETKKYRQWHEHACKSVRYYRDGELPATLTQLATLREVLIKTDKVLHNVTELYHPAYLLHTDKLFKEIQSVLVATQPEEKVLL